jgi:hypothetical protein
MKLLRHPIRSVREPFGLAGVIVACVALVAALGGGAYAASGGLSGKQKKEVEKIAKSVSKPGKTGPTGPGGANGAKGDNGATGAAGAAGVGTEGKEGKEGKPGKNGTSVEAVPVATGKTECAGNGGAVIEPEGIEICNGSPWNTGLPAGKTETGTWTAGLSTVENFRLLSPVSFAIPLASGATYSVQFINVNNKIEHESAEGGTSTVCTGTADAPTAAPGTLCVYEKNRTGPEGSGHGLTFEQQSMSNVAGAVLTFFSEPEGFAFGTWAVTAPTS